MVQEENGTPAPDDDPVPADNPVPAEYPVPADDPVPAEYPETADDLVPADDPVPADDQVPAADPLPADDQVPVESPEAADAAEAANRSVPADNTLAACSLQPGVVLRSSDNTQREKRKISRLTKSMPIVGTPYHYKPENSTVSEEKAKSHLKRRTVCGATPVADTLEDEFKAISLEVRPSALQDSCFQIVMKGKLSKEPTSKAVSEKSLAHSESSSAGGSSGDTESTVGEGKEDILQILLDNFHGHGREHFQTLVPQIKVIPDEVEYRAHELYDVRLDRLITRNEEEKSYMWVPQNAYSMDLKQDNYEENYFISHIVHLEEYCEMRKAKSILPKPIEAEMDTTSLRGVMGAWFRMRPPHGHSKYGCASLDLTLHRLVVYYLLTGRFKMYLAEVYQSPTRCISRLVMAKKTDEDIPCIWEGFELYNPGGPWFVVKDLSEGSISHKFPRFIRDLRSRELHPVEHEVEVFFKYDQAFFQKVFTRIDMLPVNHGMANNGEAGMCQKYRSGDPSTWIECPSPLSVTESYIEMGEIDEEYWDD